MTTYQPTPEEAMLIAALRSGEYKQHKGSLRSGDRFCCLSVACDIYTKSERKGSWLKNRFMDQGLNLPPKVREWLGWNDGDGKLAGDGTGFLSNLNDNSTPFTEIADIIERGEVLRADKAE